MKTKKIMSALFIACLSFGFITTSALAGNDEHNYSMRVYGFQQNSHSAGWYRQTTNYKNNWKVKLETSGEGAHTISTFWLEKSGGANVSPSVNKTAGNAASYRRVNASFPGKETVMLTAQNNNISGNEYNVSGYWDEETGKIQ
ncbi:DUF2712 domain-containing protein [Pediococcus damnosus]|uniref:DUF2712 domain-containing protein n=2 Tax=Pediococcus damnosus TaxID=51663 RepID=UPI00061FCD43|nr:DUF2712 domain-containing protein [Pediococcus damnosus]AMV59942.1 hypothetical protein ADU69_0264 [Pediococcus damnosus]AMV64186.1 hypothetical protein ADU71_0263 [Pediococcus damnosus]KJU74974.1 hypothetical protein AH70_03185 [Pediococcus damnosus LMG 28219]KRN45126.1 hypothetical protein IV84_GL000215 [Pediococcus damnosus]PIO80853.1 hypothetical protein BSQ38_03910 [Pediococcus damnosus]